MMTWEEHAETFAREEQDAIANRTCFCKCGHRDAPANWFPMSLSYDPVAGLCAECSDARKTKKGAKLHLVLRRPLDSWVDPEDEQEPVKHRFRIFATDANRVAEATDYVRSYGTEGSRFMALMFAKVAEGKPLTEMQVRAILRTKAAEKKSVKSTYRRLIKESARKSVTDDLSHIRLDDVRAGDYAVEGDAGDIVILRVRRPKGGPLKGFTVVESVMGEGVNRYGVQRPQPAWGVERWPSTYMGYMPHLVAALAADPMGARVLYEQLTGKPT